MRLVCAIIFSRAYIKHITNKLWTKKTFFIILSSIVIGNIVRYFAIKYGIDTPLLSHPVLFTSATGISSFLSLSSKTTIEMIFNILGDKQLAMVVGGDPVVFKANSLDTNLKMDNNSDGFISKTYKPHLDTTFSQNRIDEVSLPPLDFSKLDNLLNELKSNINTIHEERLKLIKEEIKLQIDLLQKLSAEALKQHIPNYMNLILNFRSLREFSEFSDVNPVVDSIFESMAKDLRAPDKNLLESNPEKFWKDKVKHVNRVRENTNIQCKLIKDYLKNNNILSYEDKVHFFTAINQVKKNAAIVADADNSIVKKQIDNSVILTELNRKMNK